MLRFTLWRILSLVVLAWGVPNPGRLNPKRTEENVSSTETMTTYERPTSASLYLTLSGGVAATWSLITAGIMTLTRNCLILLGSERTQWQVRNRSVEQLRKLHKLYDSPNFFVKYFVAEPAVRIFEVFTVLTQPRMLRTVLTENMGLSEETAAAAAIAGLVLALFLSWCTFWFSLRLFGKAVSFACCRKRKSGGKKNVMLPRKVKLIARNVEVWGSDEDEGLSDDTDTT